MPVLDGDGNARPDATNNSGGTGNGSLAINTSKKKNGYGAITPQYIVIHNTAGGTASSNADWFCNGAGGSGNCTQFITDDKEIYQIMPPTQKARHIQGSNTSGGKGCASWSSTNAPALSQCGATNSNSIGIEVADGYNPSTNTYDSSKVDMTKAVELTIELTRYLMQQYNIPIENVVRHGDTHNKPCPNRIMELGLWPYFKEQCKKRNDENKPVSFNPSTIDTSGQPVGSGNTGTITTGGSYSGTLLDTPLYASPTDIEVQLPDVDHRENTTNMDEVKGVSLIFYPPYNSCEAGNAEEHFKLFNWDRNYHFTIGKIYERVSVEEIPEDGDSVEESPEEGDSEEEIPEGDAATFSRNTRASSGKAHVFNVDDGLCVLLQNGNVNTLVDCGEVGKAKSKDVITQIKNLGVTKLDHIIITHFHSDHAAGFKDFSDNFEIGDIYYKPLDKTKLSENEIGWKTDKYYDEILKICKEKYIDEYRVTKNESISNAGIKIFVGETEFEKDSNYNAQSLSLIATMNGKKLFIAGDIVEPTEKKIVDSLEKCDAMIIGHHGYTGSNCQELLDKVNPDMFIVTTFSTTQENQQEVIDRVDAKNNEFYSTHNNGKAITLDFTSDKITHDATVKVKASSTNTGTTDIPEGDPVGGDKILENTEGFEIVAAIEETRQSKGFTDNDTHTYIDRALFQNKKQKHNLTVALMCPENVEDYPAYEKAMIEGLSIILHEHALEVKDLWREFDLNRAPSPFLYLERDHWKDLLTEVEKQLNWRNTKYGAYTKEFYKYSAGSSGLSGGSTGSITAGTIGSGIGSSGTVGGGISMGTGFKEGKMGPDGYLLLKMWEGYCPSPEVPPEGGGNMAIAYGCTKLAGAQNATYDKLVSMIPFNEEQGAQVCYEWMNNEFAAKVFKHVDEFHITQQCQFDALCDLAWNCGQNIFDIKDSDVQKLKAALQKNPHDEQEIRSVLGSFRLKGFDSIKRRRGMEADLFFGKMFDFTGITIWKNGKPTGEKVSENGGKGWLPSMATEDTESTDPGTSGTGGTNPPVQEPSQGGTAWTLRSPMPRSNYIAYVGDSLIVGMGDAVPSIKTYATKGHTVWQGLSKYATEIIAAKPLIVVMSYGTNDAGYNNVKKFVSSYKEFIKMLKDNIPNVQIFINKIFPGDESKATGSGLTCVKGIPALNAKLSEIAQAGATVIDCTGIPNLKSYYSSDGIHFNSSFYKLWHEEIQAQINGSGSGPGEGGTKPNTVFGWPCPGISKVSSKFGPRVPPCPGASDYHGGIDIGAPSGTPILAYAAGTVVQNVAWHKSAGNYIKIDHGSGVASRYLHMVQPSPLKVGDTVTAGQEVGKVGATGIGTGAHLHFEIHINGEKVDPLEYVTPGGGSTGKMTNLGDGSGGTASGGSSASGGQLGAPSDNLLYDDKQQDKTNAPIGENSAGDVNHDDWGGKMVYKKGEPTDPNAEQPEILNIITQEMYNEIIQYSDFKLVDDYVMDFEPYSKGLASVDDNQITSDDRLSALTKKFTTRNENTFHYKVIESGPGSKDHCVTIAEELNYLAIPQDLTVEPIYPDLVIPPGYVSTDIDTSSPNTIPIAVIEENGISSSEAFTAQMSFDYDLLKDKKKESNKKHHPVNYTDPYPYDEKITDLERHYPKVFIDEIEGQLYSCNHPGCPISQPMAKNFAMVSDAMLNQSKRIEKRLSRLENVLSTVIRNQGRLGSRMNINCVYYGGHSTFNKYKCIRCLHDDRIHDGELVTIDQCLNCTRFEPILGQVYRILDDSGLNGSIILDDMQMSYTDLEGFKNLNDITHRSSKYFNAMATDENNCKKPDMGLIDLWKEADKEQAIAAIRAEATDEADAQTKIDALKEEDYIFKMDWAETFFNSQEPDTKLFPNEGIVARQKAAPEGDGDQTLEDAIAEMDPVLDADVIEELKERIKIRDNIWIDTREKADAVQINKYTSENFFFEDFNKLRIGKYGIKFSSLYNYNGEDYNTIYAGTIGGGTSAPGGSSLGGAFAGEVRNKIVEMAKKILADCEAGKAWYSQPYRTVEYDKPVTIKAGNGVGKTGYDCTSFVSCCYMYAGLKSMYSKTCSGGTLVREIQKGGKMFPCNQENLSQAKPGDILLTASGKVTQAQCDSLAFITTSHAAIYVGNSQIIHARGKDKGIQSSGMDYYLSKGNYFFVRPADLLAADQAAAQQNNNGGGGGQNGSVEETSGSIDGQSYVAKIPGAVVTAYHGGGQGANGPLTYNAHCASHNMPYGTKIYIPGLKGKAGTGIFTVQDTGGCFFDFDIYTTSWSGKTTMDAYVLEWGSGKISKSYTWAMDLYNKNGSWNRLKSAWVNYKNMGGKLVGFLKFNQEDANITSHPNYNS